MNLTTRCTSCGTAFRVQPAQLSARGGKVRCGKCGNVFDGVKALVAEGSAPDAQAQAPDSEPSPQLGLFEPPKPLSGDAANEDAPVPTFLEEAPPPRRRFGWALAALLALAGLLGQVYIFRDQVAATLPLTRPLLDEACLALKCVLRLQRNPKQMAIESSDLQTDGRRENVIVLNAVIRNQASVQQEYPSLELTLTDDRDEAVARRVLAPADYLAGLAADALARGIGPGADAVLRVYIDTTGLRAIGYRMYLFYP
ncbi:MAG TPA: DUF3426 domain-containing protein [Burkholderiales bacterium]